jgi:hypothetical protein
MTPALVWLVLHVLLKLVASQVLVPERLVALGFLTLVCELAIRRRRSSTS